jgi:hypothetical protein
MQLRIISSFCSNNGFVLIFFLSCQFHWTMFYIPCTVISISMFSLLSLGRYLCRWTINPEDFIRPIISVPAPTWYWHLHFLNKETKVLFPQACDLSRFWWSCLFPLAHFPPNTFLLIWSYLMKVIPETCRVH